MNVSWMNCKISLMIFQTKANNIMTEIFLILSLMVCTILCHWLIMPFIEPIKQYLRVNWKLFVKKHIVDKDPED